MLERLTPNLFSPNFWRQTWQEIRLVWRLMRDSAVPWKLKLLPVATGVYLLSPFDLIPGFLPIIGQLDDLAFLLLMLDAFIRMAPQELARQYRDELGLHRVKLGS